MMSNLNFSSIASGQAPQNTTPIEQAQIQPQQEQQAPAKTALNSNPIDPLTGCLAEQNTPKKSNIGKLVGAIGGFLAPLAGKVVGLCKGQNIKTLFNLKQLAITCPLIGAAGLGVGVLVDSYLDTKMLKTSSTIASSTSHSTTTDCSIILFNQVNKFCTRILWISVKILSSRF